MMNTGGGVVTIEVQDENVQLHKFVSIIVKNSKIIVFR